MRACSSTVAGTALFSEGEGAGDNIASSSAEEEGGASTRTAVVVASSAAARGRTRGRTTTAIATGRGALPAHAALGDDLARARSAIGRALRGKR